MNRYERAFIRFIYGWEIRPTSEGFDLLTPVSFERAPEILESFSLDWESASVIDVADLLSGAIGKAEALHLHTSVGLDEVERLLRSTSYQTLQGWLNKVKVQGIEIALNNTLLTQTFGVDPVWLCTQEMFTERYPKARAITLVPLPNGCWDVSERYLCNDYGIHGNPASELIGWWADDLSSPQEGGLESLGSILLKELVLWFCQHPPKRTEEEMKS